MFCSKCGTQASEGAAFCQKCGAKFTAVKEVASPSVETANTEPGPGKTDSEHARKSNHDFREYVDNHVQTVTKFQSADDLLKNSKPLRFIWICIGVPAIVGLALGGPVGMLIFGALLGYTAVFIASGIIRTRCSSRFGGSFTGEINSEELCDFLNKNLKQINPYFHEWGYLSKSGLVSILEDAIANATEETRICSEFGVKKKRLVAFYIKPKTVDAKPGEKLYYVDALKNGFLMDGRAAGFLAHGTLIRTAPILQAAMEYYLQTNNPK